jgi:hypothetical protein
VLDLRHVIPREIVDEFAGDVPTLVVAEVYREAALRIMGVPATSQEP